MRLQSKVFISIFSLFLFSFLLIESLRYFNLKNAISDNVLFEMKKQINFILATRSVLQERIVTNGIPVDHAHIDLLPCNVFSQVAARMEEKGEEGFIFRRVSDRPRNPHNKANRYETETIQFFRQNPGTTERLTTFAEPDGKEYFFFAIPLVVDSSCLHCHGSPAAAPSPIRSRYSEGYDYVPGGVAGIIGLRFAADPIYTLFFASHKKTILIHLGGFGLAFVFVYWLMQRAFISRLAILKSSTEAFARGDYQVRCSLGAKDELGELAAAFDSMAEAVAERNERLRKSEASLAHAQRIAHLGSWEWVFETDRCSLSEEARLIFGLGAHEESVPFRTFLAATHPEDLPRVLPEIENAVHQGRFDIEYRIVLPDGSTRHIQCQGEVLFKDAGASIGMAGTVLDITLRRQTEEKIRQSEEKFRSIFMHAGAGMITVDPRGKFLSANPFFCQFSGYSEEELLARNIKDFMHPDDQKAVRSFHEEVARGERKICNYEARFTLRNGEERWMHVSAAWLFDAEDRPQYSVALLQDLTERRRAEKIQAAERAFLQTVIDGITDPILAIGRDYQVLLANRAARKDLPSGPQGPLLCHQLSHHSSSPCEGLDHPCPLKEVLESGNPTTVVHEHIVGKGERRTFELLASPFRNDGGEIVGIIEASRDITDRLQFENKLRMNQEHLEYLAYHDSLTDLPNRLLFQEHLHKATAAARRCGHKIAVLLLDLDRFKNVNDSLGHQAGDRILREVGARIRYWLRGDDVVARLGGDEFGIILDRANDFKQIAAVAGKLIEIIRPPIQVEEHDYTVTASIGISIFPTDAEDTAGLIKYADMAMYRAKEHGRNNFIFYTPDMNARTHEFLVMEIALRKALENEEFILHFQPQYDLVTNSLVGMEALLRWCHPGKGMIAPNSFIPLAEETGLIVPIGEWVLRAACRQGKNWQEEGITPFRMAVNISSRQFREPDFVASVEKILQETGFDPQYLELEITESVVMENVEKAILTLSELKSRGITLSVDDFGTGYSSLSYLKRFPIDHLKIDRTFVRDINHDTNDAAIASSVIALAHTMGLRVIAEGMEVQEQLQYLQEKGCDMGQGFYFSRPLPAEEISRELRRK